MNKLLLGIAIPLYIFYGYGFYQWLQSGHNFHTVWKGITSDWFLAITVLDLSLFGLLCLIWLVRDMKRCNYSTLKITGILLACLISGVPVVLTYLAFKGKGKGNSTA